MMKVAIAGAGAVGRSIARELVENSYDVTLIERNIGHYDVDAIPAAHWHLGDACELSLLEAVHLEEFDVVIAATGDDKANVVLSLLAKTEFAVPRVVARVNDPRNEWLFDDTWGVDVAVSTPRMLASASPWQLPQERPAGPAGRSHSASPSSTQTNSSSPSCQ